MEKKMIRLCRKSGSILVWDFLVFEIMGDITFPYLFSAVWFMLSPLIICLPRVPLSTTKNISVLEYFLNAKGICLIF